MSGSMFSLISNSNISLCNRRTYNYGQVSSENNCKDYKNISNFERKNLDQSLKKSYDAFESFSRDLRMYMPQGVGPMSNYSSLKSNQSCKSLNQSPNVVSRNPSTTPKIVGAEVKKNIKYQPVYMQRHSASFGDGFVYQAELRTQQIHQAKRSSVALGEGVANFQSQTPTQSRIPPIRGSCVRDRVSFFNKLASESASSTPTRPSPAQSKGTFLSLLRKNETKDSKATIVRLSQVMSALSARRSPSKDRMKSPEPGTGKCCVHVYKSGSNSLPLPLRRKPSFEKIKLVSSSIAKNINAIGTNLKRHSLMEDLSLVVPVKLRIAEFEERISAAK